MTALPFQVRDLRTGLEELVQRLGAGEIELDATATDALFELIEGFDRMSTRCDESVEQDPARARPASRRAARSENCPDDCSVILKDLTPSASPIHRKSPSEVEGSKFGRDPERDIRELSEICDPIVVVVSPDGRSVAVNEEAERLLTKKFDAMSPEGSATVADIYDLAPDRHREIHRRFLKDLRAGLSPTPFETDITTHDGRCRRIRWTASPIIGEAGSIVKIVYSGHDVSIEHELRTRLATLDRLDSVGLLAGGLTHDFNNLLTIAGGNLELALDIGAMDETARSRIEAALDAIEHGGEIAHRLLKVANHLPENSGEGGTATNVIDVVNSLVEMLEGVVGAGIRINVMAASPVARVEMEPIHLEQIVLNLIMNACDAMKNEGSIVITIRELVDADPAAVEITVRDDGPGMEPSKLERIFAPFSTDSNGDGHTGLGLTTARLLIESAGGSITASSELGVGTAMILMLPQAGSGGGGVNARRSVDSVDAGR